MNVTRIYLWIDVEDESIAERFLEEDLNRIDHVQQFCVEQVTNYEVSQRPAGWRSHALQGKNVNGGEV